MVANCGSFHAAADEMDVSVSTISLHMRNLEDFAGLLLFDRSKKPPPLTEAGLEYLEKADAVLMAWDALRQPNDHDATGRLRLGAVHTSLSGIMPRALKSLRTHWPKLHITVHLGLSHELEADILAGQLDAALLTAPDQDGGEVTYHHIADEPLVVIKNKDQQGKDANHCLGENPIVRFSPNARVGKQIDAVIAEIIPRAPKHLDMEIDTLESVIALVRQGLGVAVVPLIAGADHLADLDILPLDQKHLRKLSLAVPRTGPHMKLTPTLLKLISQAAVK